MQRRWRRRFAPKSEGFIEISANSLQNPSVGYADSFPKRESHIISSDLGSMWASTPTNCAFAITTYIKLLFAHYSMLDDETKTSCIGFVNTACYILVYLFLNNYFAKCSTILFAASFVSSGSPKAESLRKPSPHEPKPTPGVPTI